MYYEIDAITFAVSMYVTGNPVPFLYQPDYPNGDSFDSVEEASIWAEASLRARDENELYYPPTGKGIPAELKPTPKTHEEIMNELSINYE
jgi:hypothetical protein